MGEEQNAEMAQALMTDDDREYLARHPRQCHEEVSRTKRGDTWLGPCDRLAVAARFGDEGEAYPVCGRHARGDQMVPLADLLEVADLWPAADRREL